MTPLEQAAQVPTATVLAALGIEPRSRGTYGPCPACGAQKRGKEDARGPLFVGSGWHCHVCQAKGGGCKAVFAALGDWAAVLDWFRDRGWVDGHSDPNRVPVALPPPPPPPPPKPRVPVGELRALLRACGPVPADIPDGRLVSPLALWLPRDAPCPRWAGNAKGTTWAESGRQVLIPMWDAAGQVASVRARIPDRTTKRIKTLPPYECDTSGLCMASPTALRWLRGGPTPEGVAVVEGEPAFLAWAAACPSLAVLGIISGSYSPEWAERIGDLPCLVVTDHDTAGDKYANTWLSGLRRGVRWPHLKDETP